MLVKASCYVFSATLSVPFAPLHLALLLVLRLISCLQLLSVFLACLLNEYYNTMIGKMDTRRLGTCQGTTALTCYNVSYLLAYCCAFSTILPPFLHSRQDCYSVPSLESIVLSLGPECCCSATLGPECCYTIVSTSFPCSTFAPPRKAAITNNNHSECELGRQHCCPCPRYTRRSRF